MDGTTTWPVSMSQRSSAMCPQRAACSAIDWTRCKLRCRRARTATKCWCQGGSLWKWWRWRWRGGGGGGAGGGVAVVAVRGGDRTRVLRDGPPHLSQRVVAVADAERPLHVPLLRCTTTVEQRSVSSAAIVLGVGAGDCGSLTLAMRLAQPDRRATRPVEVGGHVPLDAPAERPALPRAHRRGAHAADLALDLPLARVCNSKRWIGGNRGVKVRASVKTKVEGVAACHSGLLRGVDEAHLVLQRLVHCARGGQQAERHEADEAAEVRDVELQATKSGRFESWREI